ncbi:sialate O-acetylesterase-like [Amphiura filiformis]|uniref:sialate O-acetylesterase-like n=1 Tax=Amphiura filiformis TaxID=82378 RepID=UPI003B21CD87
MCEHLSAYLLSTSGRPPDVTTSSCPPGAAASSCPLDVAATARARMVRHLPAPVATEITGDHVTIDYSKWLEEVRHTTYFIRVVLKKRKISDTVDEEAPFEVQDELPKLFTYRIVRGLEERTAYEFVTEAVQLSEQGGVVFGHTSGILRVETPFSVTCKPAYIYGDHMVLQREPHGAVLWGYTDPGFSVNVTFKGVNHASKGMPGAFGPNVGVWKVVLPPQPAGGPFTINITCFDGHGNRSSVQLQDILFGDVWICSGQSNMAMTVRQAMNSTAELAASVHYPNVRVLSVKRVESYIPYYDLNSTSSLYHPWAKANPDSLGAKAIRNYRYFSAVCWFYGRDLHDTYKVPMGMISTNFDATPVPAWSSPDVMNYCVENAKKADVTKSR